MGGMTDGLTTQNTRILTAILVQMKGPDTHLVEVHFLHFFGGRIFKWVPTVGNQWVPISNLVGSGYKAISLWVRPLTLK